jgi:hypothetical protein
MKNDLDIVLQAKNSKDANELHELSKCFDYRVRRAVARNQYTSQETLKTLQHDPTMNVAYMANVHAIEKINFEDAVSIKNPCVTCKKDESTFNFECDNCNNDSYSRIISGHSPYIEE